MAKELVRGTKYDHSNRNVMVGALAVVGMMIAVISALFFWRMHHGRPMPVVDVIALCPLLAPLAVSLRPRWQLSPDALLDLRKKTQIPYTYIDNVRVIKSKRNGTKVFAIQAGGKTDTIDVLQGDAFADDLGRKIGAGRIVAALLD